MGSYDVVVSNTYGSVTSIIATLSFGFTPISVFTYSGFVQPYVIPSGVTSLAVTVCGSKGANGNGSWYGYFGGGGAQMQAIGLIAVAPGNQLFLSVGGGGSADVGGLSPSLNFNGGNGGRFGPDPSYVITSGGGGGAATIITMADGGNIIVGGSGGGGSGQDGAQGQPGGQSPLTNVVTVGTNTVGGHGEPSNGSTSSGGGGGGGATGGQGGAANLGSGGGGGNGGGTFLPTNYLFGSYQWAFTDANTSDGNGSIAIVANPIPEITQQPTSQNSLAGAVASMSIGVTSPVSVSCQWVKNGFAIPNATNSTLSFSSVTPQDAGNYSVVVSNIYASVTSSVAILTVVIPVYITSQPQSQTVLQGGNAGFTVAATGTPPLEYQWQKNGFNLPAATLPTYSIPSTSMTDAGFYLVIITNAYGSVTSSIVSLEVNLPPQRLNIFSSGRDGVQLQMSGTPNFTYAVQSATNLAPPIQWQSLFTNTADTNGIWQFKDTNFNGAQKFYRVTTP